MMTLSNITNSVGKFTADNSPVLLTAVGVAGAITTAALTGKASYKAAQIIREAQDWEDMQEKSHPFETKEKINLVWTEFIPAAGVGVLTIVSIVGANRIGSRRAAAVAAAYSLSEKAFTEYKDKVYEKFGQKKEQNIRDEVAQDRVTRTPGSEVVIIGDGEVLCFDSFSGRYFNSSMETLKKAQNDLNYRMLGDNYASLGDFYNLIGLPTTPYSEEVGWTSEKLLEVSFSTVLSEDQKPCISIEFAVEPVRGYYKLG